MRILFLVDYALHTSGGVLTSVNAQIDELSRQGHDVITLCPAQDTVAGTMQDGVYHLPSVPFVRPNGFAMISPFRVTMRYLENIVASYVPFDIVHCHTDQLLSHLAAPLAQRLGIPLVQSMHGRDDVFFESSVKLPAVTSTVVAAFDRLRTKQKPTLKNTGDMSRTAKNMWGIMMSRCDVADAVTIPSTHLTELFIHHGLNAKKVHTISNGLKDAVIDAVRISDRISPMRPTISLAWASRVSHEKQPLLFLEMLTKLTIPFRASMYGEGDQLDACKAFIEAHELSDSVVLHGKYAASDSIELIRQSDLLVYTSDGFDNQPMVLFESVAAEVPVIFCDPKLAEGMPTNGALLSEAPTAALLAEVVSRVYDDPELYISLKRGMRDGKDFIRQSIQTKKMVQLYEAVIKEKSQR